MERENPQSQRNHLRNRSELKAAPKAAAYYEVDGGEWYWWDGSWGDKVGAEKEKEEDTQIHGGGMGTVSGTSIRMKTLSLPKH